MASTLPHLRAQKVSVAQKLVQGGPSETLQLLRRPKRFNAPTVVRYWHLASLDAPTVAIVWSLAFARAANTRVPAWVLPLELLVVWAVYVSDRLLDAQRGLKYDGEGMRDRHWFHWNHRRILAPFALFSVATAACIAFRWMPAFVWQRDSIIGLASLAYFAHVHGGRLRQRVFSKEMLVGILFTAGCALPALSWSIAVSVTFFAALAWLNCAAIEQWESSARTRNVSAIATCLATAGLAAAAFSLAYQPRAALLLFCGAASASLLAALDRSRSRITPLALRAFADLALLTPALLLATMGQR